MIKSEMKKRNWTFVLYDDSCAKDWEEYLISTGVPFAYAYHDKDKTEIGEPKKPHYHVVICFDGPITYHNVIENYINKVDICVVCVRNIMLHILRTLVQNCFCYDILSLKYKKTGVIH